MSRKHDKYAGVSFSGPNDNRPSLGKQFGCQLFKFENVTELLMQLDERIDIIDKVSEDFRHIEGIDLIDMWRNLFKDIQALWMQDKRAPFITLTKLQEIQLHVIADIVALFFLHNGSEEDNDFLKNVQGLFTDVNGHYNAMPIEERFAVLKTMLAEDQK